VIGPAIAAASSPSGSEIWWTNPRSERTLRKSDLNLLMRATRFEGGGLLAREMHVSKSLNALGLMSGTSLDGIDVALLRTDGKDDIVRGSSRTYPYEESQRALLRQAIAEARELTDRRARPGCLAAVEAQLTAWHAAAVQRFCAEEQPGAIDIIGFHGQTVIHRPEIGLTLQLGDGAALARATGLTVAYDLRADDVAAGGQGAPLVPAYHRALAAALPERPVALVNIGGVANLTWIGRGGDIAAFDTGPGNALLNDWCERHIGQPMDRDGALAARGHIDVDAFAALADNPYFDLPIPKSLDRNAFDLSCLEGLSPADGAMTLVHFTATSLARSVSHLPERPKLYVICGGGRLNPTLMRELRRLLEPHREKVVMAEEVGLNGDSVEAEAWAYLAVRAKRGLPITYPLTTGVPRPLSGGVFAMP
jgi:anhydro-N-acetylmuramic acid kinase